jgi:hypothetical protein
MLLEDLHLTSFRDGGEDSNALALTTKFFFSLSVSIAVAFWSIGAPKKPDYKK